MKRAIISGVSGSIGSALINELLKHDVEVLAFTRPGSKRNNNLLKNNQIRYIECEMNDYCNLKNDECKEYDIFYHLAWAGTSGQSRNDMYLQNSNVKYSLDAVNLAKRFGCKRFLGAGSQAEYGRHNVDLKPDTPTFPENGYGYAKLCAGQMTKELSKELGMEHIWTRILSIYGINDGSQSMIMSLIRQLKEGRKPSLTNGEQIWDYLYANDAAKALYMLGDKGKNGQIYVLGSGQAKLLREYIDIICKQIGYSGELGYGEVPYSEKQLMYLCADISQITKDTGWKPETDFYSGIAELLKYQ